MVPIELGRAGMLEFGTANELDGNRFPVSPPLRRARGLLLKFGVSLLLIAIGLSPPALENRSATWLAMTTAML